MKSVKATRLRESQEGSDVLPLVTREKACRESSMDPGLEVVLEAGGLACRGT